MSTIRGGSNSSSGCKGLAKEIFKKPFELVLLNKFNTFMSTKNSQLLYKISNYIAEAFEIRSKSLNDLIII